MVLEGPILLPLAPLLLQKDHGGGEARAARRLVRGRGRGRGSVGARVRVRVRVKGLGKGYLPREAGQAVLLPVLGSTHTRGDN